jgi:hypothetical protein
MESSFASQILRARGAIVATFREQVAQSPRPEVLPLRPRSTRNGTVTLNSFLAGLKCQKAWELMSVFADYARFVDVFGKQWNREELYKQFETLFAPYAKKNAAHVVEKIVVDTNELLVVVVLWRNAILASMERVWMHRMSVVLVPAGDDWTIILAQVTPVQTDLRSIHPEAK